MQDAQREPLALVGIGCRLPGGIRHVEQFWQLLLAGRSAIGEVPPDRWNIDRYHHQHAGAEGRIVSRHGGFVDQRQEFDAAFWGISPREAKRMDPQQRWLLETAWEALEDAGMVPSRLRGSNTGVYVGISTHDYGSIQLNNAAEIDVHTNSGGTLSIAANRVSYLFDFKGPSVAVDTACSSALVAFSMACQAVWEGDCDLALAGGVNALLLPNASVGFSKAGMLSRQGKCFAFDERAEGYVRGEGAGMVVVKPLSSAIAAEDPIYCVVRSAVVNQDGNTSSMTVPGIGGQSAMLRAAYDEAGVEPRRVSYVEAHGTGTPVGDPIEATALGNVLSQGRDGSSPCLIGSVKTNVGHLEAASGIAGLIKAALVAKHEAVVPSLNFETPNPNIPFDELQLQVATQVQPLPKVDEESSVVAVNSFGFGGTNAHAVLQSMPSKTEESREIGRAANRPFVLPISARDDVALRLQAKAYLRWFADNGDLSTAALASVCFSAGQHREHHPHRLAAIGHDANEIRQGLDKWLEPTQQQDVGQGQVDQHVISGAAHLNAKGNAFVFTGQGPQWWGMGRQLLKREPVFRQALDQIDCVWRPCAGWSLLDEFRKPEETSRMQRTDVAQPAIFAMQAALVKLWRSWGVSPDVVVGHSVGEVAAAYCAGIYDLTNAVRLVYHRSRLQQATAGNGRMLAAGISAAAVQKHLMDSEGNVHLAAINSRELVTLSGEPEALEVIAAELESQGCFVRWLGVNYAFHSHQMDSIRDDLLTSLSDLQPQAAQIPFISTVTGDYCEGKQVDATYWWHNVRRPVLFSSAISRLSESGTFRYLEIGPHPSLRTSLSATLSACGETGQPLHSLKRDVDESVNLLTNLAGMHLAGADIDWASVSQTSGKRVTLPAYSWNYEDHWLEGDTWQIRTGPVRHPFLDLRVDAAKPTWQFSCDTNVLSYLKDHGLWDSLVFPAAGYAEIGLAVAQELFADEPHVVENLSTAKAMFVADGASTKIQVTLDTETKEFAIHSCEGKKAWELNAQGCLVPELGERNHPPCLDVEKLQTRLSQRIEHDVFYELLSEFGYQFGPDFSQIGRLWRSAGEALALVVVPRHLGDEASQYEIHPTVLDAFFQATLGAWDEPDLAGSLDNCFFLPTSIGRIQRFSPVAGDRLWAHVTQVSNDGHLVVNDIDVYSENGQPFAKITGLELTRVQHQHDANSPENSLYQFQWQPKRLAGTLLQGSSQVPPNDRLADGVKELTASLRDKLELSSYLNEGLPLYQRHVLQVVENALLESGWDYQIDDCFTLDQCVKRLGIAHSHRNLISANLTWFEKHGKVCQEGDRWRVLKNLQYESRVIENLAALEKHPRLATNAVLSQAIAPHFAAILQGIKQPLEVLFPEGDDRLMRDVYESGGEFPALHQVIRAMVQQLVACLPQRRAIRVLEIGAGTGALTELVLGELPADRCEYLFTDIGTSFLVSARQRFAAYPFVKYQKFDIERSPQEQEIPRHSFDLIVASNVVHATANLRETLSNLKACLADDGLLLFQEIVLDQPSLLNSFGLLAGWWRSKDDRRDQGGPLVKASTWQALLQEAGFVDVSAIDCASDDAVAEQAVLLARAPKNHIAQCGIDSPPPGEDANETSLEESTFLVIADSSGFAAKLTTELRSQGHLVIEVSNDDSDGESPPVAPTLADHSLEEYQRLLEQAPLPDTGDVKVIHCTSLDNPAVESLDAADLMSLQSTGSVSLLHLAQAFQGSSRDVVPRIYVLTRAARCVLEDDSLSGLAAAPVAGFVRVASNELKAFRWTMIDLPDDASPHELEDLIAEITSDDAETDVALRDGRRFVNRFSHVRLDELPVIKKEARSPDGKLAPFRLQSRRQGVLDQLTLNATTLDEPKPDEIGVEVHAGGINFRDVMKALAMYPGNPVDLHWYGDDFAGVVTRAGSNVTTLKPGDRVAGMAAYAFRSQLTIDHRMVFKLPEAMALTAAATLPTVFLTADFAINQLARMRSGEKILIHAAAGGVGQAAVQLSQQLGLEIFATAGTPEKRDLLRKLGVPHVMDSRTLHFADEIMRLTDGAGVDAVLNSLAGDFLRKSVEVLAPFGRFLEIGKVDVYGNTKIGLESLKDNIAWYVIDLAQVIMERPECVADSFASLAERFASGELQPLTHKVFGVTQTVEAFRYMAQGKHIGKNVLCFDEPSVPIGPNTQPGHRFKSDATYLITGGAGGLGLEVAKWMAREGARHLTLVSRSGPNGKACDDIAQLRADGVQVDDARVDVTDLHGLQRVIEQVEANGPPLDGVIHGAMTLDDEFISELDAQRLLQPMRPKIQGAWNLHLATRHLDLSHFICFSSISACGGAIKQSNYNAGNCFLEALASYRNRRGLPAVTIAWGAILGAGFVERNRVIADYLDTIGVDALSVDECTQIMAEVVGRKAAHIACSRVNWQQMSRVFPAIASSPVYANVYSERKQSRSGMSLKRQLSGIGLAEKKAIVEEFLAEQIGGVLGVEPEKVDRSQPLTHLGIDSLMAVELMNRIEAESGIHVSLGGVLSGPNLIEFAEFVLNELGDGGLDSGDDSDSASRPNGSVPQLTRSESTSRRFPVPKGVRVSERNGASVQPWKMAVNLHARVNHEDLRQVLADVAKRNEILRTTIRQENGCWYYEVDEVDDWLNAAFTHHGQADLGASRNGEQQPKSSEFGGEVGPLVRFTHLSDQDEDIVGIQGHPAVVDQASIELLMGEIVDQVTAKKAGGQSSPSRPGTPRALRFRDYAHWQRELGKSEFVTKQLQEWARELDDACLAVTITADAADIPHATQAAGHDLNLETSDEDGLALRALAAELDVTPTALLLAALATAVHVVSHENDFVIHHQADCRDRVELRRMLGPLAKSVPMPCHVAPDYSLRDAIVEAQQMLSDVELRQHLPMGDLTTRLACSSSASTSSVRIAFQMNEGNVSRPDLFACDKAKNIDGSGNLVCQSHGPSFLREEIPTLLLNCWADGAKYRCDWVVDGSGPGHDIAHQLARLFHKIVTLMIENPLHRLSDLTPTSPSIRSERRAEPPRLRLKNVLSAEEVNWEQEISLPPTVVPTRIKAAVESGTTPCYLLTGATGFVGAFLLDELLQTTDANIICLVRADNTTAGRRRLADNLGKYELNPRIDDPRVRVVVGDLKQPRLGLSEPAYDCLTTDVDEIFHVAANVNLLLPYGALRDDNVGAVEQVLRFAMLHKLKPLHYVSTFTVHTTAKRRGGPVGEEDALPECGELLYGYSQTKWVSEHLVRAAKKRGLPVTIYRPGHVTGHSQTGASNVDDLAHAIGLACVALKAVPEGDFEVDISPVDYVVGAISQLARQPESSGATFHLTNPQPLGCEQLQRWSRSLGLEMAVVPGEEWCDRLQELSEHGAMPSESLRSMVEVLRPDNRGMEMSASIHPRFDCSLAQRALAETDVRCHAADARLLETYIRWVQDARELALPEPPTTDTAAQLLTESGASRSIS